MKQEKSHTDDRKSLKLPKDHPGTKKLRFLMESGKSVPDILYEFLPGSPDEIYTNMYCNFSDEIIKLSPDKKIENKLQGIGLLFNFFIVKNGSHMDEEIFTKEIPALLRGYRNYDDMINNGGDSNAPHI